jgi:hypothetical protein
MNKTYKISCKHFTANIVTKDDIIIKTTPILKYVVGWHIIHLLCYADRKGWKIESLKEEEKVEMV